MPKGIQAKGENEGKLIGDVMEMLKNISSCLSNFTPRFQSYVGHTPPFKDLTQNTRIVWVKKGTHAWSLTIPMHKYFQRIRVIVSCIMTYAIFLCHCFRFKHVSFTSLCRTFLLQVFVCLPCFCWSYFVCFVYKCVEKKNSKTHKKWKILKSLIVCIV